MIQRKEEKKITLEITKYPLKTNIIPKEADFVRIF